MIIELILFLLTFIIGYYLYSYKKLHGYFKDDGVKFLPGVPLFGNVLRSILLRRHFLEDLQEVYDAFPDEKYIGFFELTMPIVLIKDPEIVKSIVVKDFDHFTDHREFFTEELDPLFGGSLLFMKGERWRDMRTTLSPAFTASKMKYMLPFILDITNNIVEYLQENQNTDIDIDDLSRRYTNDVIAAAGLGLQVNSVKDRDNEFYVNGNGILDFNLKQRLLMFLVTQFPALGKRLGVRFFSDTVYNFFTNLVTSTMEYRKKEKVARPDMVHLLMETKKDWTPIELTGQVFIFFSAGYETSATTLTMTIHELALNPDIQEKLYQECRQFEMGKKITYENLTELKYLDCVINESLRRWSPAIILDRTCTKTYELPPPREGGQPYTMQPGDILYNVVNQIHLDEKHWPDPHTFDPERFNEENKANIKPFTFMPFGIGPRGCIGMRFAIMEIKVLIYYLILNFKIVRTVSTADPIKMVPSQFNLRAVGGTIVQFEKRVTN